MVTFDWDTSKNESNRKKHRLGFETARLVFDDPNCLTFVERIQYGEERWHAIGVVGEQLVITVVHSYRAVGDRETIRIISARRADPEERKLYAGTH